MNIWHPSGAGRQDLRALGQKPRLGPVDGSQAAPLQPVVAGFFAQYWSLVMPALHARHFASIDMQQYGDECWAGLASFFCDGEGVLCGVVDGEGPALDECGAGLASFFCDGEGVLVLLEWG